MVVRKYYKRKGGVWKTALSADEEEESEKSQREGANRLGTNSRRQRKLWSRP